MDIEYRLLVSKSSHADSIRRTMYKENTNVLAYYIVTMILINNYEDFLLWCKINNDTFLQFKKTDINQKRFCRFIEQHYKTPDLFQNIECSNDLLTTIKKSGRKGKRSKYNEFLLKNLRMTLCELN